MLGRAFLSSLVATPRASVAAPAYPAGLFRLKADDRRGDAKPRDKGGATLRELDRKNTTKRTGTWATGRRLYQTHEGAGNDYSTILGKRFIGTLRSFSRRLGAGGHWIDMGGGQMAALHDYLSSQRGAGTKLRVTGVAIAQPPGAFDLRALDKGARALYGRRLDQYKAEELGKADLITDVYGPASYVERMDEVFMQYAQLLKPGGEAHVFLHPKSILGRDHGDGKEAGVRLNAWLKKAKGIEVTVQRLAPPSPIFPSVYRVVLHREEGPVSLPALRVRKTTVDLPPAREIELRGGTLVLSED